MITARNTSEKIYKIDINSKYALLLPNQLTDEEIIRIENYFEEFLKSDDRHVLVLPNGIRLEKIEE